MARGDLTLFEEFADQMAKKLHDLSTDVLKLGLVNNTKIPTAADAAPDWGDYSANDVSAAGGYTADGLTLANSSSTRWAEADGVGTLDADDISLTQNGSGFTDAYWGILYNHTAAGKNAIGFVELDGPVSEQAGAVAINWNASGILTVTIS